MHSKSSLLAVVLATGVSAQTGVSVAPTYSYYNTTVTTTTVVQDYTTVCSTKTTLTVNECTYPATAGETITVTNCPCTVPTVSPAVYFFFFFITLRRLDPPLSYRVSGRWIRVHVTCAVVDTNPPSVLSSHPWEQDEAGRRETNLDHPPLPHTTSKRTKKTTSEYSHR